MEKEYSLGHSDLVISQLRSRDISRDLHSLDHVICNVLAVLPHFLKPVSDNDSTNDVCGFGGQTLATFQVILNDTCGC